MRRPSRLVVFALSAFGWIIVLMLIWTKVSPWTSYPIAALSHVALEQGAPMWVRSVHKSPGLMQVETTVAVPVPDAGGRIGEIDVEMDPGRYAYGLPIFLALLLAVRDRHRRAKAIAGYLLLLPVQAFSATMFVLMQLVLSAQASARTLVVDAWQVEAIIYGYQLGSLVLPTLAPVVLWLWLDRQFFTEVIVRGWRGEAAPEPRVSAASAVAEQAPDTGQAPAAGVNAVPSGEQPASKASFQARPVTASLAQQGGAGASSAAQVSSSASAGLPSRQ